MVHGIIDAAIALLAEEGHAGFTTHAVAERAGISVGSLYQYFANKEMIAAAIVERGVLYAEWFLGRLFRDLPPMPVEAGLHHAIDAVNRLAVPYQDAIREVLTVTPLFGSAGLVARLRRPFVGIATDFFVRHADRYEILGGQATIVAAVDALIFMILRRWSETDPMLPDDQYYEAFVAMIAARVVERAAD